MEDVEKFNFKENVEESINFINNIISEELRVLVEQKLGDKNIEISGNDI